MSSDWTALAWLAALWLPLLLLKRWLSQHLQGLGYLVTRDAQTALLLQYLVLLPGILLHELSHLAAATLVGVRVTGISLRPTATRGRNVRLGAVMVRPSDPVRESWIGLAPLLSGTAVILLLARWQFGISPAPMLQPDTVIQGLAGYLRAPDAWLWLYLIFSVSNAMLPSESDRRPWGPVLLFLGLAAALLYATGHLPQIPASAREWVFTGMRYLVYAFGLTIGVDLLFGAILFAVEKLAGKLLHRSIEY